MFLIRGIFYNFRLNFYFSCFFGFEDYKILAAVNLNFFWDLLLVNLHGNLLVEFLHQVLELLVTLVNSIVLEVFVDESNHLDVDGHLFVNEYFKQPSGWASEAPMVVVEPALVRSWVNTSVMASKAFLRSSLIDQMEINDLAFLATFKEAIWGLNFETAS